MGRRILQIILILTGLSASILEAQTDSLISLWAEFSKDDPDFIERIQELNEHPVHLNSADKKELLSIPLLTPFQADSILALREKLGVFRSKRQIRSILGNRYYELIKALVTIHSQPQKNGAFIHKNYFPLSGKYEASRFLGSLIYDYNKLYYIFSKHLKVGLITQKDAGETSIFDYLSGYIEYKHSSLHILAGSYKLEYGEGLLFSDPFGRQKSSMATLPFRSSIGGARPTLSSSENMNQFGLFGEVRVFSLFRWQVFYAGNLRDARLDAKGKIVIGLDYDGYHRTEREIAAAGRVTEQLVGSALSVDFTDDFTFGMLACRLRYTPFLAFDNLLNPNIGSNYNEEHFILT
ncbi:MAG TPA: helix-hairpin-helix domain-containing protein [Calditrichaeota bacterium]|nr:helix-hairpin-helix domain-containing protein [Calditrichota bacterium]